MRTSLLSFLLLLLHASCYTAVLSRIPENIVQKFIKKNADFSVDPCYDFYAHACPSTSEALFFSQMQSLKYDVLARFMERHPEANSLRTEDVYQNTNTVIELIKSGEIRDLCLHPENEIIMTQFARQFLSIYDGQGDILEEFKAQSCEKKADFLKTVRDPGSSYQNARFMLTAALNALGVNLELDHWDKRMHEFFEKLRKGVFTAVKNTPWAKRNRSVAFFLQALLRIKFTTFADLRNHTMDALQFHKDVTRMCKTHLDGSFEEERINAICDVIASGSAYRRLMKPTENVYRQDMKDIFGDQLVAFNSQDDRVYMGNDFLLLMNTDFSSDLYGTIGFSMTHEIMHTLVFDDGDIRQEKPLVPFWTNSSKCVEEQNLKTCSNFPTIPCDDQRRTFEEDAADLASYRVAYDLYRKAYDRKTHVKNYEALDTKQLFFYGAAVVFCNPQGMKKRPRGSGVHTNDYQRVNSIMSQMDEFADAFQCKPTDKMVRNKATHCELYGKHAPLTRKNSNDGL